MISGAFICIVYTVVKLKTCQLSIVNTICQSSKVQKSSEDCDSFLQLFLSSCLHSIEYRYIVFEFCIAGFIPKSEMQPVITIKLTMMHIVMSTGREKSQPTAVETCGIKFVAKMCFDVI